MVDSEKQQTINRSFRDYACQIYSHGHKVKMKATSVIDCEPERVSISMAFKRLYSNEFQSALQDVDNPYFKSDVATNIIKVLESFPLDGILKKQFYDIPVTS